jgi:metal-dependent amidase/aminoacylase/carboxypeptidase family protein
MRRSVTAERLVRLRERVNACFEAGALATGATLSVTELGHQFSHMECDSMLLSAYRRRAEESGRHFRLDDDDAPVPTISTDMANVLQGALDPPLDRH